MSDNTTLNIGIGGDVIATEDPGLGYKLPVSKIRLGSLDVDGGDVTIANPFPILITDGYNGQAAIKPPNVAATASDPALVVSISPNGTQQVSAFNDEFGISQYPTVRLIDSLWTLQVTDQVNREFHERNTIALESLLDIENNSPRPTITSTAPISTDFGMVVRQAGSSPTEADISGTGSLSSLSQAVNIPINGVSTLAVNILGTWTGTLTFYYSVDGVTYFAAANPGFIGLSTAGAAAITTAANGTFTFSVGALKYFKIQFSAYTSGQAIINYNASVGSNSNTITTVGQITAANLNATATQGSPAVIGNSWYTKISDTVNGPVTVKASGVAPLTTDLALTVSISPNSSGIGTTGAAPNTKIMQIGGVDLTNTMVSVAATTLNGIVRLQVNDDSSRLLLEQILLTMIDIRSILAATSLKGETVSMSNIDSNNGN